MHDANLPKPNYTTHGEVIQMRYSQLGKGGKKMGFGGMLLVLLLLPVVVAFFVIIGVTKMIFKDRGQ